MKTAIFFSTNYSPWTPDNPYANISDKNFDSGQYVRGISDTAEAKNSNRGNAMKCFGLA
jgi:hypothetical protein